MRLLLDTHVLLWWLADDARLGPSSRRLIEDGTAEVFVSSVSVAEVAIKTSLGKLDAPPDLLAQVSEQQMTELPLRIAHAQALRDLPWLHRDPFDRMLVAQALTERLTFVTADARCRRYDIDAVPA